MDKVSEKKVARKVTKFIANICNDTSIGSLVPCSISRHICLVNVGLANGFTREELLEIFISFGEVQSLIMVEGRSFSILTFKEVGSAAECVRILNGCYSLRDGAVPLYMYFLERVDDNLMCSPKNNRVWPIGLVLKENIVAVEDETRLLELPEFKTEVSHLKNRTVKHFGFGFNYGTNKIDKNPLPNCIPTHMKPFLKTYLEFSDCEMPNQLTVTHYEAGQGIPLHIDTHSSFEDVIAIISLGSDVVMDFRHPNGNQASVVLPRRSCLIMTGESRYMWSHGIVPRKYDVVESSSGPTIVRRGSRMSLTFRRVRMLEQCNCIFPACCDSKFSEGLTLSEDTADALERNHVFNVYNEIADHFSATRHQPWPKVEEFITNLPVGSLLLDVGCGNGKYLKNPKAFSIGCDRSHKLLQICSKLSHQVINADCRFSPIRDGIIDAVICIAVIHHLATEERRLQAIRDISRVLRIGGCALIYVWAKEQQVGTQKSTYLLQKKREAPERETVQKTVLPIHENRTNFKHNDIFVPWKTQKDTPNSGTFLRYYHVFQEGELEVLSSMVPKISVKHSYYDQGNWCVVLQKKN